MATCYRLVKSDYPEYFDLGKATSDLFEPGGFTPFILPAMFRGSHELAEKFYELMLEGDWNDDLTESHDYAVTVANKLFDWARWDRVIVVSDVGFDVVEYFHVKYQGIKEINSMFDYTETGTRYEHD